MSDKPLSADQWLLWQALERYLDDYCRDREHLKKPSREYLRNLVVNLYQEMVQERPP